LPGPVRRDKHCRVSRPRSDGTGSDGKHVRDGPAGGRRDVGDARFEQVFEVLRSAGPASGDGPESGRPMASTCGGKGRACGGFRHREGRGLRGHPQGWRRTSGRWLGQSGKTFVARLIAARGARSALNRGRTAVRNLIGHGARPPWLASSARSAGGEPSHLNAPHGCGGARRAVVNPSKTPARTRVPPVARRRSRLTGLGRATAAGATYGPRTRVPARGRREGSRARRCLRPA